MPDTHDIGRLLTHSVRLADDAPIVHRAITAEFDDPCRYSNSLVVRTRFRRKGRWHGVRKSWLSLQIKLPTGERQEARWGIVLGWWRYPEDEGWSALLKAVQMGREPDERDSTNFELPTSESVSESVRDVDRRRVEPAGDAGADE
jgi:hypothetical protein